MIFLIGLTCLFQIMPELNIEKTKKTLGQSIKRPPLSEKLLSKPPYRYLYDIIMEVNEFFARF